MATKYIFITGGVVSSLGKGITAASLGLLLKNRGLKVSIQKFDPYINVDPGTLSPYQHGEVFVTDDGAETDLDLGHYERFIDLNLSKNSSVTSGKIYWSVINKERHGDYNGSTVQVIPHITDEIKSRIKRTADESEVDVVITEIGGTVGDIESLPFMEAIRQIKFDVGKENVLYLHVTLVPFLKKAEEVKTKPTQHSVHELRGLGIQPDVLICRTEVPMDQDITRKIAFLCDIEENAVIPNMDADSLYEVPLMLEDAGLAKVVIDKLGLKTTPLNMDAWKKIVEKYKHPKGEVKIALVGKYIELKDAYLSVSEALNHAGISNDVRVHVDWINSENITADNVEEILGDVDGVLVPGGFGNRGIEGKIQAVKYARENNIPFLGICLGMQMATIEFARHKLGMEGANTTEIDEATPYPVIDLIPEQQEVSDLGGTMRLGLYPCVLDENSKVYGEYGDELIYERHRHRWEFNMKYRSQFEDAGFKIVGLSPDKRLVEAIELEDHPWFVAVQFHPEFKSRPIKAHPLFKGFVRAAKEKHDQK